MAPQVGIPSPLNDEVTALADEVGEGRERMLDHDVLSREKHDVLKRKEMRGKHPMLGPHPSGRRVQRLRYIPQHNCVNCVDMSSGKLASPFHATNSNQTK